jgi:hypothetical protein
LQDIFGCYRSSSLHWQGKEDKNLLFLMDLDIHVDWQGKEDKNLLLVVDLDIHVVIFVVDLSKGKEPISPNNNKPPTC